MLIYKITCKLNDKNYVGKTTRSLEERIAEHLRNSRTSYIDRAIQKHGLEKFSVEIIETCEMLEQLNEREIFWIRELNCKNPNGYNLTDGGEGTARRIVSDETRRKISKARTGRKSQSLSEEHRKKISRANKGLKRSEEYCRNISERQYGTKRKPHSEETRRKLQAKCKNKRPVRCVETNEAFESIKAAAKWAKVNFSTLSVAVGKSNRTAGGYHWQYANQFTVKPPKSQCGILSAGVVATA